jgi:hypothetical protein
MSNKKINREYTLSDSTVNAYGFRLLTAGYVPELFDRNPVGFYNHKPDDGVLVKWENITVTGDIIKAIPTINLTHPRGERTVSECESGFLNAASVGKIVVLGVSEDPNDYLPGQTGPSINKWYFREASLVEHGGNWNAIALVDAAGSEINLSDLKPNFTMKQFTLTAAQLGMLNLADNADANVVAVALKDLADKAAKVPALEADLLTATTAKDKAVQDLADLQKATVCDKVKAICEKGLADKKLTKELSDSLAADYATNPDGLQKIVDAMPAYQSVTAAIGDAQKKVQNLADKSWEELDKSGKLEEFKAADLNAFKAKYQEKFGVEYSG